MSNRSSNRPRSNLSSGWVNPIQYASAEYQDTPHPNHHSSLPNQYSPPPQVLQYGGGSWQSHSNSQYPSTIAPSSPSISSLSQLASSSISIGTDSRGFSTTSGPTNITYSPPNISYPPSIASASYLNFIREHVHDDDEKNQAAYDPSPNDVNVIPADSGGKYRHGDHVYVRRRLVDETGRVFYSNWITGEIIRSHLCNSGNKVPTSICYAVSYDTPPKKGSSTPQKAFGIFSSVNEIIFNNPVADFRSCSVLEGPNRFASLENEVKENTLAFVALILHRKKVWLPAICIKRNVSYHGECAFGHRYHVRLCAGEHRDKEYVTYQSEVLPYNIETVNALRHNGEEVYTAGLKEFDSAYMSSPKFPSRGIPS